MNVTSPDSRRWVPMTTSTSPVVSPSTTFAGLGGREEPGQHLDPHRIAGEAVGERLVVLLGQQRGGHEHGDLVAVLHRLERGPHGDLGLAEPDVAADQAVHGRARLHVGLHVLDGRELVRASPGTGTTPSSSRCHGVSWPNAWPAACARFWYRTTSSWAIWPTADRTLALVRAKSAPPIRLRAGRLAAGVQPDARRSGRTGRRACRRRGTRAAGSRARRRRWTRLTMPANRATPWWWCTT